MEIVNHYKTCDFRLSLYKLKQNYKESEQEVLKESLDALFSCKDVKMVRDWASKQQNDSGNINIDIYKLSSLASSMNDKEILHILPIIEKGMEKNQNDNLVKLCNLLSGIVDAHVVLVQYKDHWMAIGEDADNLFQIMGWQTSTVESNGETTSWMEVTKKGYRVLKETSYTIKRCIPKIPYNYIETIQPLENDISMAQQIIDFQRRNLGLFKKDPKLPVPIKVTIQERKNNRIIEIDRWHIEYAKVKAITTEKRGIILAQKKNWDFDDKSIPVILAMGDIL